MKYYIPLFGLLMLAFTVQAQNLTFYPEKPVPGEEVKVKYDPSGTPLEGVKAFETTAYLLEGEMPKAVEVKLERVGDHYQGTIATAPETKALFVTLQEEKGEKIDNNDGKGHRVKFHRADQSGPVPGAYAAMGQVYGSYYRLMGIERDFEQAINYMRKEFKNNPAAQSEGAYLSLYATLSRALKDEEARNEVLTAAETMANKKKATEKELNEAYYLYLNLREEAKAEELAAKIKKKYKKGELVQRDLIDAFYNAEDLESRRAYFEEFSEKYGEEEKNQPMISNMAGRMAGSYGAGGDWDNFAKYIAMVDNPQAKASSYNSVAWPMSGESIDAEPAPEDVKKAKEISFESLQLVKEEMETAANKPDYFTAKQWKDQLKYSYGMYADTYALLAYHAGDYAEALKYQQISCDANEFSDGDMNERYAVYFAKVKEPKESMAYLEGMIREGKATGKMKDMHRDLFMKHVTLADAYDKYMVELGREAEAKMKEEMKKKMISEPAPAFTLTDLEGKEVSLESLKGKVVILDFWATWCGPCKASFPGMQKAVDKYASNADVVFLFVNSWESGKEKKKSAGDFIEQNNYSFRVLMDEKDEVIAKYKVEGIPTKFIIGKDGQIRFKSVGYNGNNDELVKELSLMIEMAGSEVTAGVE